MAEATEVTVEVKPLPNHVKISDFFQSEALSDFTMCNPSTQANHKVHRVILASGSKYFLELFHNNKQEDVPKFNCPKPIQTSSSSTEDDIVRVLKYLYHSQDFTVIKEGINANNVFALYSQAYVLQATNLLASLETMIVEELLTPENCTQFYYEAIRFKSDKISKACEELITQNFQDIERSEKG
jgi:hypothetical protein